MLLVTLLASGVGCASDEQVYQEIPASDVEDTGPGIDTDIEDETPLGCTDEDYDSVPGTGVCDVEPIDCDDGNRDIFPGATEVCNGKDDDCDGLIDEGVLNECGGCTDLDPPPGQVCGECGRVVCNPADPNVTDCEEGAGNICGGCELLSEVPGQACGICGLVVCADLNDVGCLDPGLNECGQCAELEAVVGDACGECGTWVCDDDGLAVSCLDSGHNACDGCGTLSSDIGDACGECGTQVCRSDGSDVTCSDPGHNACDGCGHLEHTPGSSCGQCGTWTCTSNLSNVTCHDSGYNACDGCGDLAGVPRTSCGTCKIWTCFNGDVQCQGDDPMPYYLDGDGDGYGLDEDSQVLCSPEGNYDATRGGDCDDTRSFINPGFPEYCDGWDNDCDGRVDEDDGDCSSSEYCFEGSCAPMPTWDVDVDGVGGCLDLGILHSPAYTRIVTGRPGATWGQANNHLSCGTGPQAPGVDPTPLDASGNFQDETIWGDVTDCEHFVYGTWQSWAVVDGRSSNVVTTIYYNSNCTGLTTCNMASDVCFDP